SAAHWRRAAGLSEQQANLSGAGSARPDAGERALRDRADRQRSAAGGFLGGNADLTTNAGNPGPAAPTTTCSNDDTWGRMIGWRVSGVNNGNAGFGCTVGYLPNTDILTVRYAGPEAIDF